MLLILSTERPISPKTLGNINTALHFYSSLCVSLCKSCPAIFDTIEESTYIDEAALVLQFYDTTLWPLLGLTPAVHLAMSAWVHFRCGSLTMIEDLLY